MNLIQIIRQLFCRHDYRYVARWDGRQHRIEYYGCEKCGRPHTEHRLR